MTADIPENSPATATLRRGRKPKSANDRRMFLKHEKVEVRSVEEGFLGSWHSGTVILCKNHVRQVRYDYLLSDDGRKHLIDRVQVSPAIDGLGSTTGTSNDHRNLLRPPPPPLEFTKSSIHYGQCVDVFYEDAWWEGVIFDYKEGSDERAVFFPDMGDELNARMNNLRITQTWDEINRNWDIRGDWLFLDLIEEIERDCLVLVSSKQIWYEVRVRKGFENLKEWTSSGHGAWKELILEVVFDALKVTALEFVKEMNCSCNVSLLELDGLNFDDILNPKSYRDYPCEVVPFEAEAITPIEEETNPDDLDGLLNRDISMFSTALKHGIVPYEAATMDMNEEKTNQNDLDARSDIDISTVSMRNHKEASSPALLIVHSIPDELSRISELCSSISPKMRRKKHMRVPASLNSGNALHVHSRHLNQPNSQSQPNSQITPLLIEQPVECQVASNHTVIEAEYCPQALMDYVSFKRSGVKRDDKYKEVKLKALRHLSARGWIIYYYPMWTRKEIQYRSPCDKVFKNLLRACEECLRDEKRTQVHVDDYRLAENRQIELVELDEVKAQRTKKRKRKSENGSSALVQVTTDLNCTLSTPELRSGKRVRQALVPSPSHNAPKTVLSWLIEKNVVLPRAKVYYNGIREGHVLGEGRVTRDGIKCNCCQSIFNFKDFENHLGSTCNKPTANLFLEDGKSVLECQLQLKRQIYTRNLKVKYPNRKGNRNKQNDDICSVCHYGGDLVLCDQCPSSFHMHCVGLKEVPQGDWFCPCCCCKVCGKSGFSKDTELFADNSALKCDQCEKQYHVGCLKRKDQLKLKFYPSGYWFCNKRCEQIFKGLCKLLRKPIPLGVNNLTWTLVKHDKSENYDPNCSNIEELMEGFIKLHIALDVMHECFEPVKEPRTKRDLVEDIIFGERSDLHRLNFKGFYTILLERNGEVITVATVRIYGEKVAEVPLVATRFQYRRLGMCRILMNELEKKLTELGVERLVLPAVPSVLHTWTSSFGFSQMTESERLDYLDYTFLDFQGTFMCQKLLTKAPSTRSTVFRRNPEKHCVDINMMDVDVSSVVSVVYQADEVEENRVVDQRSNDILETDATNGNSNTQALVIAVDQPMDPVQCQSDITTECLVEVPASNPHTEVEKTRHWGNVICYKRRKHRLGADLARSKLEESCFKLASC